MQGIYSFKKAKNDLIYFRDITNINEYNFLNFKNLVLFFLTMYNVTHHLELYLSC